MNVCNKRKIVQKNFFLRGVQSSTQPFKLNSRIRLSTVCVYSTVHIAFSHRRRCRHFCCYCRCRLAHFMRLCICVYMEFCVYPTAIKQYSTQFTLYFPSGRLYRSQSFTQLLFSIYYYTRVRIIKYIYIFVRRRVSIDNAHQKTVEPVHSFQRSSRF